MLQNIKISKSLKSFLLGCIIGLGIYFILPKETETIEVPVQIEVPVPIVEKEFDTIFLPKPINNKPIIDSIYYKEYLKLKDSIKKDSVFKDAIKIREYRPIVEDDTIRIEVYNKVRGTLLESQISYKTKPYKLKVDTILNIPVPKKPELYLGGGVILPTDPNVKKSPSIEVGGILVNKKHNKSYNITYDPVNKVVTGGIYFRL